MCDHTLVGVTIILFVHLFISSTHTTCEAYSQMCTLQTNYSLDQGYSSPVLEGRCPACFRCFPLPTHLFLIMISSSPIISLIMTHQVCWKRETSKTCRTPALQDLDWTPLPLNARHKQAGALHGCLPPRCVNVCLNGGTWSTS